MAERDTKESDITSLYRTWSGIRTTLAGVTFELTLALRRQFRAGYARGVRALRDSVTESLAKEG